MKNIAIATVLIGCSAMAVSPESAEQKDMMSGQRNVVPEVIHALKEAVRETRSGLVVYVWFSMFDPGCRVPSEIAQALRRHGLTEQDGSIKSEIKNVLRTIICDEHLLQDVISAAETSPVDFPRSTPWPSR